MRKAREYRYRFPKILQVKFDSFMNKLPNFFFSFAYRYATRQIGDVCSEAIFPFFYHDHITHNSLQSYFFKPDCFNTPFKVPLGISTLSLPAIVTVRF